MSPAARRPRRQTIDLPDTPAARRLRELTGLMEEATPARVIAYISEHYTPANAGWLPLEHRIGSFMDWHARGGMTVVQVTASEPWHIEAAVYQPVSDEHRVLLVDVEPEPPHRVDRLLLGRSPSPSIAPPLHDQAAADQIVQYAERLGALRLFSGAVLVARYKRVLGETACGLANRDFGVANNLDTRFNVGSINKMWTAIAIAQLVEAGRLSFSDCVSNFFEYPTASLAARIRIEHLLTHTSGLQNYFTDEFERTSRRALRTLDDFLALSKDQPLAFAPGSGWRYSNTGMVVLGKIIEIVSGESYFDYVRANVLDRAGMKRSGFFELDRVNENLAVGYARRWSEAGCTTVNNIFEHVVRGGPAGGAYSTVADLFRFSQAFQSGRLVSRSMATLLATAKPELGSPLYGYGFAIHPEGVLHGHDGRYTGIGANLDMVTCPAGWTIVVLANDSGMRSVVLKARDLIGVTVSETTTQTATLSSASPRPR